MSDSLYADSAQARAGTELRQTVARGEYDWRAAADRRERDAVEMRARVLAAVIKIERALGCSSFS